MTLHALLDWRMVALHHLLKSTWMGKGALIAENAYVVEARSL